MKPHSEEHRRNLSKSLMGHKHSAEAKRKMSEARIGKVQSDETKRKRAESLKGNKNALGARRSEETKKKMSRAKKGRKQTPEHIINNAISRIGYKHTKEAKEKVSKTLRGRKKYPKLLGETDKQYKNRLHKVHHSKRRALEKQVTGTHNAGEWGTLKAQYNWTCPCCGKSEPEISLTEDHIIPLSKGGSNNIENIQPLCISCNHKKYTKIIAYLPIKAETQNS